MNFLSLFSGIGGLDLGLERAGMRCVGQVEIDPFCRRVLAKHWPDVSRFEDVEKFCRRISDCEPENEDGEVYCPRCKTEFGECGCVGTEQYTDEHGFPDLIVGGDPCQRNANCWRHGTGAASLGCEFVRIVDQLRPLYVLRENPAVVRSDAPWPWHEFRSALEDIGYAVVPFRVRACCAGADHKRERLFLFAELQDADRAGLEGDEREVVARTIEGRQDTDAPRPNRWNATPRICRGADGIPNRVDRLRGLGNAVVPQVAEIIGRAIIAAHGARESERAA
jgi:DNA (cytosine-5)-methyltransferase 1